VIWYEPTPSATSPSKHGPVLVATECGEGTGDVICTFKDSSGRRWKEVRSWGETFSMPRDSSYAQVIRVRAAPAVPEFDFDPRKYWSPPPPPANAVHLPPVRDDRRVKRVVIRPEFHARSNPRPRR
jgi:hypothetical protein